MLERVRAGRINGIYAPAGSIMGPQWTDELLVVMTYDGKGVELGFATPEDLAEAPRICHTLTEWANSRRRQVMERARIATLFGGQIGL